jgi:ferredoxin
MKSARYQDVQPTVIFGVHTCDMHGIMLFDKVFAEGYRDEHYVERRKQTYIVGFECLNPCDDASFCKDMGTLTASPIYDLHMTEVDGVYLVDTGTERGERLLLDHVYVQMAQKEDIQKLGQVLSAKWPRFRLRLKISKDQAPSLLTLGYKAKIWEELGERCLACGSCTNVCPTCFCFDVQDRMDVNMQDGERARVWDSCQLREFALVAGGHNFRSSKAERVRHRLMRKGKYIKQVHGLSGCTGCGRCERACLVHILSPAPLTPCTMKCSSKWAYRRGLMLATPTANLKTTTTPRAMMHIDFLPTITTVVDMSLRHRARRFCPAARRPESRPHTRPVCDAVAARHRRSAFRCHDLAQPHWGNV